MLLLSRTVQAERRDGVVTLRGELPGAAAVTLGMLSDALAIVVRGAIDAATCARWCDGVVAARAEWTADFGGEQFALGRAFYTHLETGRSKLYFDDARASDLRVERWAPGLQARLRAVVAAVTGGHAIARRGWCGPGVHVFPAGEKVAREGGVVHFDLEGLGAHHLAQRRRALSIVAMLQPPVQGGGLRLWDVLHPRREDGANAASALVEYGVGDVVVFDSYRLHQIQPFEGAADRVSATVHAAEIAGDTWETWF